MMLSNSTRQRKSATIYHNVFYFNHEVQMLNCRFHCAAAADGSAALLRQLSEQL